MITGGATGIGWALAESFVKLGNRVIICGRRLDRLEDAKKMLPALSVRQCDVSKESDRQALYAWVEDNFKTLDVLVNNAGIQRRVDFTKGTKDLLDQEDEIDINFKAQVYLVRPVCADASEAQGGCDSQCIFRSGFRAPDSLPHLLCDEGRDSLFHDVVETSTERNIREGL